MVTKKYLRTTDIFNYEKKQNTSWQWRKLMDLRDTFQKGLIWQIGDGKSVKFWKDRWATIEPLDSVLSILAGTNPEIQVVDFIDEHKKWKEKEMERIQTPKRDQR